LSVEWLLFNYKVPNEPSARRVFVWRKLKALGAILLHDSVWVLPTSERTREKLQWLASEIKDMDGEAMLWEAKQLFTGQGVDLVQQFNDQVDALYQKILHQLEQASPDLTALAREYQQASSQDYFQSKLGQRVRKRLMEKRRGEAG
jgi:polysaccharide pyruvyl transferase WcaK-like protein